MGVVAGARAGVAARRLRFEGGAATLWARNVSDGQSVGFAHLHSPPPTTPQQQQSHQRRQAWRASDAASVCASAALPPSMTLRQAILTWQQAAIPFTTDSAHTQWVAPITMATARIYSTARLQRLDHPATAPTLQAAGRTSRTFYPHRSTTSHR